MAMSDKTKWSYLAGLLDGEGHITIRRAKTRNKRYRKDGSFGVSTGLHYVSVVAITNTSEVMMRWVKETFGGNYYPKSNNLKHLNWKPSFDWHVSNNKAMERLLLGVLPYLIVKKEQAKLALSNIRLGGEHTPETRQSFYEGCIALTRKGRTVETNTSNSGEVPEKIESELTGDSKSDPVVTPEAVTA